MRNLNKKNNYKSCSNITFISQLHSQYASIATSTLSKDLADKHFDMSFILNLFLCFLHLDFTFFDLTYCFCIISFPIFSLFRIT